MLQNAPMYAYIPAKDVARARKFYEEKVGFSRSARSRAASPTSSARAPVASLTLRRAE